MKREGKGRVQSSEFKVEGLMARSEGEGEEAEAGGPGFNIASISGIGDEAPNWQGRQPSF